MQWSLTLRQKQYWVSELDWCLASQSVLSSISEIRVVENLALPSNHAIVSFMVVGGCTGGSARVRFCNHFLSSVLFPTGYLW